METDQGQLLKVISSLFENNKIPYLIDAAFIYQMQEKKLDFNYLNKWTKILKVEKYLKKLAKIELEKYL